MKRNMSDGIAMTMSYSGVDMFRKKIEESLRTDGVPGVIPRVVYMFLQRRGTIGNSVDNRWFKKLASLGLRFEFSDTETMDCPYCDNVELGCWSCDSGRAKKLIMHHNVAEE